MDYRERFHDPQEALRAALGGHQSQVWTALPGIIQKVDVDKMTCEVQPAIQAQQTTPENKRIDENLPLLPDVPLHFPSGGGYTVTFPVKEGDECLVIFAARCIDNWWQEGGIQPQFELRMHDLSDAFAIPKVWSQKTKINNISTTNAQLRSDDGTRFVEIDTPNKKIRSVTDTVIIELDSSSGKVTVTAPTEVHVQCPLVTLSGDLHVSGAVIAGYSTGDQVGLQTHRHTQGPDSHLDAEVPTNAPTTGT
jgi:hypothetical protein